MTKIFISYSSLDKEWKDRVVKHLKIFANNYFDIWEDSQISIGDEWEPKLMEALNSAHVIIMLISANFLTSDFINKIELPNSLKLRVEKGVWVIPLFIKHCAWDQVDWLSKMQMTPPKGKPLSSMSENEVDENLANLARDINNRFKIESSFGPSEMLYKEYNISVPLQCSIYLSSLPSTGAYFVGRDSYIEELDNAWESNGTNIVVISGFSGMGKTALINKWLNKMSIDKYKGARKIFAWSFNNTESADEKNVSTDEFILKALQYFNDSKFSEDFSKDKWWQLANLVRKDRFILILDGLEVLQCFPTENKSNEGKLKDQGMRTLLKELAAYNTGLCIISTRYKVTDLMQNIGSTVAEILQGPLTEEEGINLLEKLGANGPIKIMQEAVKNYDGYPLALTLLGSYIHNCCDGDIRRWDTIVKLSNLKKNGYNDKVYQLMNATCEKLLGSSKEMEILQIVSFFYHPAQEDAVNEIKKSPPIKGLTEHLQVLSNHEWKEAITMLRKLNLLSAENPYNPAILDCYRLIKEYFREKIQLTNIEGWKEAHKRLYEYYKKVPWKECPDTLEEMRPLFAAIIHGCAAGKHKDALLEVYWPRIRRGNQSYITNKMEGFEDEIIFTTLAQREELIANENNDITKIKRLGAFIGDLSAVSNFFEDHWNKLSPGLDENEKASVLSWAAHDLTSLGRLVEAVQPTEEGYRMRIHQGKWKNAAIAAVNLSEIHLTLGRINEAIFYAYKAIEHATFIEDKAWKMIAQSTFAYALYQNGRFREAEDYFLKAEGLQRECQPDFQFLYSVRGFQYCDFLLEHGRYEEVRIRAEKNLDWAQKQGTPLDIALSSLSLVDAFIKGLSKVESGLKNIWAVKAGELLDQATVFLGKYGSQQYLPRGLLAIASYNRIIGELGKARQALENVLEIAETGNMWLYLTDYHLEMRQLLIAEGKSQVAKVHLEKAFQLINETGYKRRLKIE